MLFPARLTTLALALAGCVSAAAQSVDGGHVDRVTLSSGGLIEVHRSVAVQDQAVVRFDVPLDQVDDVLKSLVVADAQGTVGAISLDGMAPVAETFKSLPFTVESLGSLPDLLQHLPGTRVRVSSGGRTVEGRVLGTSAGERKDADGATLPEHTLSVMTDDQRIDVLRLGTDATLDVLDKGMRDRLAAAVATLERAQAEQIRSISIAVGGSGKRDVGLTYVTAAPVWKPAFRLLIQPEGKARLQGWAVLENATGEDWKNVALTLVSGAPVALSQRLYERYWRTRPEIPVMAGVSQAPRVDNSAALAADSTQPQMMAEMAAPPAPAMAKRRMAAAPMVPAARPASAAVAEEGQTSSSFHLPTPVTLERGRTLSVPFLDADIPAQRLALFQPDMGSQNPVAAVMVKNITSSSLPPGILTVYDTDSGYVGDAQMPAIPAGEERLASFAADRKVQVSTESRPEEHISRITVNDGILTARTVSRVATTYTIKGAADGPRTVLIEHPRRDGWTTQSAQLTSSTPTQHRLKTQVAAGAVAKVEVVDEQPTNETFALADAGAQDLLQWSDAPSESGLGAKLKALARSRAELAGTERAIADLDARLERSNADQARVRENLAAVPAESELGRRYLGLMASAENAIEALNTEREQAAKRLASQQQSFRDTVRTL